jgi:hypothetical protein
MKNPYIPCITPFTSNQTSEIDLHHNFLENEQQKNLKKLLRMVAFQGSLGNNIEKYFHNQDLSFY